MIQRFRFQVLGSRFLVSYLGSGVLYFVFGVWCLGFRVPGMNLAVKNNILLCCLHVHVLFRVCGLGCGAHVIQEITTHWGNNYSKGKLLHG